MNEELRARLKKRSASRPKTYAEERVKKNRLDSKRATRVKMRQRAKELGITKDTQITFTTKTNEEKK